MVFIRELMKKLKKTGGKAHLLANDQEHVLLPLKTIYVYFIYMHRYSIYIYIYTHKLTYIYIYLGTWKFPD